MNTKKDYPIRILEQGYRPTDTLDTSNPPQGGSAVSPRLIVPNSKFSITSKNSKKKRK